MKEAVDAEAILDTAARLIELDGVNAFTMRGLAENLGVAVTSIYWHVGGRDKLFDSLVDRLLSQMAHLPAEGDNPVERIASLARSQRTVLSERQHLLAIAHERDRTPLLFLPIQQTLAAELAQVGVTGTDAALILRAIQVHVISSAVMQFSAVRGAKHDEEDTRCGPTTGRTGRSSRRFSPPPTTTPSSSTDSTLFWRRCGALSPTGSAPQPDADADGGAAEPDDLLRRLHLMVNAHAAQQIRRIGSARGEEPTAGVLPAQWRRHQQSADQRIAVAHRTQQELCRRGRLVGIAPEAIRSERIDEKRDSRSQADTTDGECGAVYGHGSSLGCSAADSSRYRVG